MKTIQEELGGNTQEEEIDEMLVKAKDKKWDEKTNFELSKMRRMNPAPDFGIQRNYLVVFRVTLERLFQR
jgi:ATP-dependent Lon protease